MHGLTKIFEAKTPQELHEACWEFRADEGWAGLNWALAVVPRDYPARECFPQWLPVIGSWGVLHDAQTGKILDKVAFLFDLGEDSTGAEGWRLAVELEVPILIRYGDKTALLPKDASASEIHSGGPLGAVEALGVVFGVGKASWDQCLYLQHGAQIPGFPKTYRGAKLVFKGKSLDL
jgi:hypothetical protein